MIPILTACNPDELDAIHEATLEVMWTTGVRFTEASANKVFRDAGFRIDENDVIYFPRRRVEDAIKAAPASFTREGLDPACKVVYGTGACHFGVGSLPIYVYDLDTGARRPALQSDMRSFSLLGSRLEHFDISNACVQGMDVPEEIIHLVWLVEQFETSRKPFCSWYAKDRRTARETIALGAAALGGIAEAIRKQTFALTVTVDNALTWGDSIIGLVEFAAEGLCVEIMPMPMAGSCDPVTLAGTVVQGNAEILAAVVLAQLIRPGTPVIYAPYAGILDMRAATHSFGCPEVALMATIWTELSRRYAIPNDMVVATADSKIPDAQAAYEKTLTMILPALARADTLSMCGGMLDFALTASYEQLVIDNDIIGAVKRQLAGVTIDRQTLAVEAIRRMKHHASYLEHEHTLANFRREQYDSKLRDRSTRAAWETAGSKDTVQRARDIARELLSLPPCSSLDESNRVAMLDLAAEIRKERGGDRLVAPLKHMTVRSSPK